MKGSALRFTRAAAGLTLVATWASGATPFHFDVTTDPHMGTTNRALALASDKAHFSPVYRDITLRRIMARPAGPGAFMVVCGDLDDFDSVRDAIEEVIAGPRRDQGADYPFYPVVGNHDVYNTATLAIDIDGRRTRDLVAHNRENLQHVVNWGPDIPSRLPGYGDDGFRFTTYSFDYGNAHFVVLDQYGKNDYQQPDGKFPARGNAHLFAPIQDWLATDLAQTKQEHTFVFGHQGMTGRLALKEDAGDGTLWSLLAKHPVRAYFHGHEHAYSINTEQPFAVLCAGHPRDSVTVFVEGGNVRCETFIHASGQTITNILAGVDKPNANPQ
jgi:hypothetical protein